MSSFHHGQILSLLKDSLWRSLESYRGRLPGLSVEVGDPDDHRAFVPAIAELMAREESRGTKGMSGGVGHPGELITRAQIDLEQGTSVLLRTADELVGFATIAPWEVENSRLVEFCSAVVDDPFRGMGLGRLLVDAREVLVLEELIPAGYQPIAFCNSASARIYNRDFWQQVPWEWYRRYPPPVTCKAECQWDQRSCDCTVLALDLDRIASLVGARAGDLVT